LKKTQEQNIITSLDLFDESISLWQLLPTSGTGLQTLKHTVDAELNHPIDRGNKPLSLLVTGVSKKRTHSRAFLRALGIEIIKEIPASLLNTSQSIIDFFYLSSASYGYLITDAHQLREVVKLNLYQILTSGQFHQRNFVKQCRETFPVYGTIVFTATKKEAIPASLSMNIEHHVGVGKFDMESLVLATLQRIKYANLFYESEECLRFIVDSSQGDIRVVVECLRLCLTLLRGQNENEITMEIVKRAAKLI